ncbi:MAG: pentapeptide repeat-containing protein [Fibrobacteres bacterium]|nr:pentapeptide repeat-containing protein [Fibrobacterota bacterium]
MKFLGVNFMGCRFLKSTFKNCEFTKANVGNGCSYNESIW